MTSSIPNFPKLNSDYTNLLLQLADMFHQLEESLDQLKLSEEKNELIRKIDKAILESTDSYEEVFKLISDQGVTKTGSYRGEVMLYTHNKLKVVQTYPQSKIRKDYSPPEKSLCYRAVKDKENKNIGDVFDKGYPEIRNGDYHNVDDRTKSELVVLIKPQESERILGVLNFERDVVGEFSQKEVDFAELLAGQCAIAIGRVQMWRGIQLLNKLTASIITETPLDESFKEFAKAVADWTDCERCYLLQKDGNEFLILGSNAGDEFLGYRVGEVSLAGQILLVEKKRIFREGKLSTSKYKNIVVNIDDREHHSRSIHKNSVLITALMDRIDDRNELVGALFLEDSREDLFSEFEEELLKAIATVLAKTIVARSKVISESMNERIEKALYVASQLEGVNKHFVHRYGKHLIKARGDMEFLKEHLQTREIPEIADSDDRNKSVSNFIDEILKTLSSAGDEVIKFQKMFSIEHILNEKKPRDLLDEARRRFSSAKRKYGNIIDFEFNIDSKLSISQESRFYVSSYCELGELIVEVINDLVMNAVESIKKRTETAGDQNYKGKITFSIFIPNSQEISLEIRDNGIGIDKSIRDKIFKSYSSKKDDVSLHGLGLQFCDIFVHAHGGEIIENPDVPEGASFIVTFPTVQSPVFENQNGEELL